MSMLEAALSVVLGWTASMCSLIVVIIGAGSAM